jgi:diacylglycerol kinase family enzyme
LLILANLAASGGRGAERWRRVAGQLDRLGLRYTAVVTASIDDGRRAVDRAIAEGHPAVIAAGGDGTVNAALNALLDPATDRPRADLALGAIGLGSSNDFHKPFDPAARLAGVPVRLAVDAARPVDVGKAVVTAPDGALRTRYFLLNGGLGLVAEGNDLFNRDPPALHWLKRRSVRLAILAAAAANLLRHRPVELALALDGAPPERLSVTNLGILKRVHFAGGMRYDTGVRPDDGWFDVNLWRSAGLLDTLTMIAAVHRGRFRGRPGARALRARRVELRPIAPARLELDGEIDEIASATVSVLPRALRLCGPGPGSAPR